MPFVIPYRAKLAAAEAKLLTAAQTDPRARIIDARKYDSIMNAIDKMKEEKEILHLQVKFM